MGRKKKEDAYTYRQTLTLTPQAGKAMEEIQEQRGATATSVYREAVDLFLNRPPERFLPVDTVKEIVRQMIREEILPEIRGRPSAAVHNDPVTDDLKENFFARALEVREILARNRRPAEVFASLNRLSSDIARAVDHDAAQELWTRYQRGEKEVFSRRLCTPEGQETLDSIMRQYRDDREFQGAVDRYCEEFSELLKPLDEETAMIYLMSATGKVYAVLSLASGRL